MELIGRVSTGTGKSTLILDRREVLVADVDWALPLVDFRGACLLDWIATGKRLLTPCQVPGMSDSR